MVSEYARAGEGIGETKMQSLSVSRERLEQVESDLKDTQSKLSETLPKLVATREQLQHSGARACDRASRRAAGFHGWRRGCRGPETDGHRARWARADPGQLQPSDADDAYQGQTAQIRFLSVHNRTLPLFSGTVRTVSADSFTDEKTGRSYFRVEIIVPETELNRVRSVLGNGGSVRAFGQPALTRASAFTAVLIEPLTGAMWRSGHED